jgi:hypothetical protein
MTTGIGETDGDGGGEGTGLGDKVTVGAGEARGVGVGVTLGGGVGVETITVDPFAAVPRADVEITALPGASARATPSF